MDAEHRDAAALDAREHVACPGCGADEPRHLFDKHGFTIVRCRRCDLAYVTPRPPRAVIERLYDADYFRNPDTTFGYATYVADRPLYERLFAERMAGIERFAPRGRLLDVGCATGVLLETARARGWQVHGVELSEFGVQTCRGLGLPVTHGDLHSAAFPADAFDVVVMDDTVEHLADPRGVLREVHRILAPGGVLTVNTPNEAGWLRLLMRSRWFHYKPKEHLQFFSPATLSALLDATGFAPVSSRRSGKIVTTRYLCDRMHAYSEELSRLLMRTVALAPGAQRPFLLPLGEFVMFARKR